MVKRDAGSLRCVLVIASSGGSSTQRVHVWRRLRRIGAAYLQQGVAVLPDVAKTRRALEPLQARAAEQDATLRILPMTLDSDAADEVRGEFDRERGDEYGEIQQAALAFVAELETERRKGRVTYTEFEESEAELHRLDAWLKSVRDRDYFGAAEAPAAVQAVEACRVALEGFEQDAYAAETSGHSERARSKNRPLRAV